MSFIVSNTTEVHLIAPGTHGGSRIDLDCSEDFSTLGYAIFFSNPGIAGIVGGPGQIVPSLAITPVAVGETFATLTDLNAEEVYVRIQVHDAYQKVWFAHREASLFQDEHNFTPTIYAQFDDATLGPGLTSVGDVTYHLGAQETDGVNTFIHPNIRVISTDSSKVEVQENGQLLGKTDGPNPVDVEIFVTHWDDPVAKIIVSGPSVNVNDIQWLRHGLNFAEPPIVRVFGGSGSGVHLLPVMTGLNVTGLVIAPGGQGAGFSLNEELVVTFTRSTTDDAYITCGIPSGLGQSIVNGDLTYLRGGTYDEPPVVRVIGGGGIGAKLEPVMAAGAITGVTIVNAGTGYTSAPQIVVKRRDQVLPVLVKKSLKLLHQLVVERIPGPPVVGKSLPLLFISEGFSNKADFMQVLLEVQNQLFSPLFEPYRTLRSQIEIYAAYIDATEDGITCKSQLAIGPAVQNGSNPPTGKLQGLPVTANPDGFKSALDDAWTYEELVGRVGISGRNAPATLAAAHSTWNGATPATLPQDLFDYWKARKHDCYAQGKNTPLGYSCGNRWATLRKSKPPQLGRNYHSWYMEGITRAVVIDDRRATNLNGGDAGFIDRFLCSLKKLGGVPGDPDYHLGAKWTSFGPNYGLVGVICNETMYGGTNTGFMLAANVGEDLMFPIELIPGTIKYNNFPNHVNPVNNNTGRNYANCARVFAHELGHGKVFDFQDEYEDIDNENHTVLDTNETEMLDSDNAPNTTHWARISHAANPVGDKWIDASKIKWDYHRVNQVSVLTAAATSPLLVGNTISFSIKPTETAKWNQIQADGLNVYLATINLNPHSEERQFCRLGSRLPMTIQNIDNGTGEITLTGDRLGAEESFPVGSYLYTPRLSGSTLTGITITNPGMGYTRPPVISFQGHRGTAPNVIIGVSGGSLDPNQVRIAGAGGQFHETPQVTVTPHRRDTPTTVATVTAQVAPAQSGVTYIKVLEGGSNYTVAPDVEINGGAVGGGNPAALARATAVLSLPTITDVILVGGGNGNYPIPPVLEITDASGFGAKGILNVTNGRVTSVTMECTGANYSANPVFTIIGAVGTVAVFVPTINTHGSITGIAVTTPGGPGYVSESDIRGLYLVTSHAAGFGAVIKLVISNGDITGNVIENGGRNYTVGALNVVRLYESNDTIANAQITSVDVDGAITGVAIVPIPYTYYVYESMPLTGVVYNRNGMDMGATFSFTVDANTKMIAGIKLKNPGSGYDGVNAPYTLHILGGTQAGANGGGGAVANIVISQKVDMVVVNNHGVGYMRQPSIAFVGGGAGVTRSATAEVEIDLHGRMIEPLVMHQLLTNRSPFTPKAVGACGVNESIGLPPNIPMHDYPAYAPYAVGIYEGGSTFNCKAYRPTGTSIYRGEGNNRTYRRINEHRFNYPCRMQMASLLDPTVLPKIDDDIQIEYRTL